MADLSEMMESMGNLPAQNNVAGGIDSTELKDFFGYVMGTIAEPPEVMNKMMNNLINKLSMGLGYNVVANISRQAQLAKFISVAEEQMFDPEAVKDMDKEKLMDLYSRAEKTLSGLTEMQRKFIVQNKDILKTDTTPQEKMVAKLMTLPSDKLDSIMKIIDDTINPPATTSDPATEFEEV